MAYKTKAIANIILNKAAENGEKLKPLKLQKLIYYACGYYQAAYDVPLIDRSIEAWDYGPVIPEIYQEFKAFGSGEITRPARELDWETSEFAPVPIPTGDSNLLKVVDFVWASYGKYSGLHLSDMAHSNGSPWDITRKKNPGIKNAGIPSEALVNHFSKFVKKKQSQ